MAAEPRRQCGGAGGLVLLAADARCARLAGGGFGLLAAICHHLLVVWLRAGTFAYFRLAEFRDTATVWRAFRRSLRHIIALALWAIVLGGCAVVSALAAQVSAAVRGLALAEAAGVVALCRPASTYARR